MGGVLSANRVFPMDQPQRLFLSLKIDRIPSGREEMGNLVVCGFVRQFRVSAMFSCFFLAFFLARGK